MSGPTPPTEWPPLQPLSYAAPPPAFPVDALPDWLADFVKAESETTQTPLDLAGMLAIATISTAIQGKMSVHALNDWVEPICAYVAVAMDPAERKSSVFSTMTSPLRGFEDLINAQMADSIAHDAITLRNLTHSAENAAKEADKAQKTLDDSRNSGQAGPDTIAGHQGDLDSARNRFVEAQTALDAFRPRTECRLMLDDVTPEAAATRLVENRENASIMSPEGGIFEILGGRYSNSVNLDLFLKAHSGDSMRVDRQGRPSQTLKRPIMTVGLAVQPGVLTDLGQKSVMRNRGLIARFMYAVPPPAVGTRTTIVARMPAITSQTYAEAVMAMALDAYNHEQTVVVELTTEAHDALAAADAALEPRLGQDGDLHEMSDLAGKHIGAIVRLAAIIATARWRKIPPEIQVGDVEAALLFSPYLLAHARRQQAPPSPGDRGRRDVRDRRGRAFCAGDRRHEQPSGSFHGRGLGQR